MPDVWIAIITTVGAIAAAMVTSWVGLKQYRRTVTEQLRVDAHQAYITAEQLEAEFRTEIRNEMERLRSRDETREKAYRTLEEENGKLRRLVTSLEIDIMRLRAQIEIHGIATGAPAITGTPAEAASRAGMHGDAQS
jgi:hypothetical protein